MTSKLPSGSQWLHEIKHDGFRIIARKSNGRVRLYSRPGNDLTRRFPLIVDALARLKAGRKEGCRAGWQRTCRAADDILKVFTPRQSTLVRSVAVPAAPVPYARATLIKCRK